MFRNITPYAVLLLLTLFMSTSACAVPTTSNPTVIILSPASGSEFREGAEIAVQSTSTDAGGVARVELVVDNVVVHADAVSPAKNQVTVIQSWQAVQGTHVLLVRAYNATGGVSSPVAVSVTVAQASIPTATATISPTSTPLAVTPTLTTTAACIDNAVFVADVTVPDGTLLAPGQTFNKIWRVRNAGCPWGEGYQLVFASGEAMTATRVFPLPSTPTSQTADLLIEMTAPTTPGTHSGIWRLRNANGQLFGTIVTVVIRVLGSPPPVPSACSGTPVISSFTATQRIIPVFGSTTLSWGPVTNADRVEIDQGIGEVGTPGSRDVAPTTTTTYTLTAYCGSQTATAQVRIVLPFAILGSKTSVDQTDYSGACPKTVTFTGTITANDEGTVTYKWESSDGSNNSAVLSLSFDGADTKTVTHTWTLGSSGKTFTDYWERLHILSPTDVTSNNAMFTLRCN
ncbi:MAG: hypothetical protein HZB51_08930 [Chloroflexi bacterium]|nr:hypothetical protein [Chloroflexota bacterium]